MSELITNTTITYGQSTVISLIVLTFVQVIPSSSVVNINVNLDGTFITVNPLNSTLYEIYGYDSSNNLQIFNETIYVLPIASAISGNLIQNASTDQNQIITAYFPYNQPLSINVYSTKSCLFIPSTYLNSNIGPNVICTPESDIDYTIETTDYFNNVNILYLNIKLVQSLIFNPNNPTVSQGNLLNISVANSSGTSSTSINYIWRPTNTNYLPVNCGNYKYGSSLILNPMQSVEYVVSAYDINQNLISTGNVKINVVPKSAALLDLDILPYNLVPIILNRNQKELRAILFKDKILSRKIINFYYTTLQTAYRMEWTNKNGAPYRMNWVTLYMIKNDINTMIINFEQQWNLFKYINLYGHRSNFYFLLNTVNQIYLEFPQKILIMPLEGASDWNG